MYILFLLTLNFNKNITENFYFYAVNYVLFILSFKLIKKYNILLTSHYHIIIISIKIYYIIITLSFRLIYKIKLTLRTFFK